MKNSKYLIIFLLSIMLICILSKYSKNSIVEKFISISSDERNTLMIDTIENLKNIISDHIENCESKYTLIPGVLDNNFNKAKQKIDSKYTEIDGILTKIIPIKFGEDLKDVENVKNNLCDRYIKPKEQKEERLLQLKQYKIQINTIITDIINFKENLESNYNRIIGNEDTDNTILGDEKKYTDIKEEFTRESDGILSIVSSDLGSIKNNLETIDDPLNNYNTVVTNIQELGSSLESKKVEIIANNTSILESIKNKHNFKMTQYQSDNDINSAIKNLCFGSSNNINGCVQSDWGCELSCTTTDTDGNCLIGSNSDNVYTDIFGNKIKLHSHIHDYEHHDSIQHSNTFIDSSISIDKSISIDSDSPSDIGNIIMFTNCGAEGALGPSQAQCENEYESRYNMRNLVTVEQGKQIWTVPKTGQYKITTIGADGGKYGSILERFTDRSDTTSTTRPDTRPDTSPDTRPDTIPNTTPDTTSTVSPPGDFETDSFGNKCEPSHILYNAPELRSQMCPTDQVYYKLVQGNWTIIPNTTPDTTSTVSPPEDFETDSFGNKCDRSHILHSIRVRGDTMCRIDKEYYNKVDDIWTKIIPNTTSTTRPDATSTTTRPDTTSTTRPDTTSTTRPDTIPDTIPDTTGEGYLMSAIFNLNKDDEIKMTVGQKGSAFLDLETDTRCGLWGGGGGGGGTFIWKNTKPIIISGGGGGDTIIRMSEGARDCGYGAVSGHDNGGNGGRGFWPIHRDENVNAISDGGFGGGGTSSRDGGGGGGGGYIGGYGATGAVGYNSGGLVVEFFPLDLEIVWKIMV